MEQKNDKGDIRFALFSLNSRKRNLIYALADELYADDQSLRDAAVMYFAQPENRDELDAMLDNFGEHIISPSREKENKK